MHERDASAKPSPQQQAQEAFQRKMLADQLAAQQNQAVGQWNQANAAQSWVPQTLTTSGVAQAYNAASLMSR